MCQLTYHNCGHCGSEFKCNQHNNECPVMNGYEDYCYECEVANEHYEEELNREERRKWEQEEWARQFEWD